MSAHPDHPHRTVGFWVSAAAGWAVIVVSVGGILSNRIDTRPGSLARFVIGGALLHDVLVAPLVLLLALLVVKLVPAPVRSIVQGTLVVTAVVALFSYPLVRGYGLAARNPTSLPHNYALNLTVVLGVVWAIAAAVLVVRLRKSR
jgi:hypothetical protein